MIKPRQIRELERLLKTIEPKIAKAFRNAIQKASTDIDTKALIAALEARDITRALSIVEMSSGVLFELDESIRAAYVSGGLFAASDVPRVLQGRFAFNGRHERAEAWAKNHVGNLIQGIQTDTLNSVRNVISEGFATNRTPPQMAREITGRRVGNRRVGGFLGLNSDQTDAVIRARSILSNPDTISDYFIGSKPRYKLSDRRFDSVVRKAISEGRALSGRQLDEIIEAHKVKALGYRGRMIAMDQTRRAVAEGRAESYTQLLERPDVESISKRWQHNLSENPRLEHQEMDGVTVDFDDVFTFSDGVTMRYPKDPNAPAEHSLWCRCTAFFRVKVAKN